MEVDETSWKINKMNKFRPMYLLLFILFGTLAFVLVNFFTSNPILFAPENYIVLENNNLKIAFENNGSLVYLTELVNKETGRSFYTDNVSLMKMTLRKSSGEKFIFDLNDLSSSVESYVENYNGGKRAIFNWSNAKIKGLEEDQIINIVAIASLEDNESTAEFTIDIVTDTNIYSLYDLNYPQVFVKGFNDNGREAIVLPYTMGKIIIDPRNDLVPILPPGYNFIGHTNTQAYSYQFTTYYDLDSKDMFYYGTKDPNGYFKSIFWNFTREGTGFFIKQVPENNLALNIDYSSPYPVVIGMMTGDWYDAAKYYKKWSIQHFTNRGRLENAQNVSSIIHDLDFKLSLSFNKNSDPEYYNHFTNAFNESKNYKDYFNLCPDPNMPNYACKPENRFDNSTVEIYLWHNGSTFPEQEGWPADYKPIYNSVMEATKLLHQIGDVVIAYTIHTHFDMNSSSYNGQVEENAIYNEDGQIYTEKNAFGDNTLTVVDPSTDFWQSYIGDIMFDHLDFGDDNASYAGVGFDGVYLDAWSDYGPLLDYSNRGKHAQGGGDWWINGQRELISKVRARNSEVNPKWILESEHASEIYANYLDFVQWNGPESSMKPVYNIPLYPSLFHEYIGFTAIIANWPHMSINLPGQDEYWRYHQAIEFSYGLFPGASNGILSQLLTFPALEGDYETLSFIKQYVRSYSYAKKYLFYGEKMKIPEFEVGKIPLESIANYGFPNIYYEGYSPEIPKILPSIWRASDGDLGVGLANWWNESENINLKIHFEDYGLVRGQQYKLEKTNELGSTELGTFTDDFDYLLEVPEKTIYFLELSLSETNNPSNGGSSNGGSSGGSTTSGTTRGGSGNTGTATGSENISEQNTQIENEEPEILETSEKEYELRLIYWFAFTVLLVSIVFALFKIGKLVKLKINPTADSVFRELSLRSQNLNNAFNN